MILSKVRIGRIENLCPRPKHLLYMHLFSSNDHPLVLAEVFLLHVALSTNISSEFVTMSAMVFINA
jgi:hypothetical protein